ncbi:DUF6412 domain-containing protein [Nocardia blacklockiae]|uniref:DUF6412 domain-containing protein n=1 Tax=Nocardia blacklockiae TaxID=480036 RepID=UPI00189353C2|nr:DUF6412 domain-containing protein [Nocardia blacklockiae]MBF6171776.1 hypothetical protein [Nocardia blacklockiae]
MTTRIRSAALLVCALVGSALAALVMPVGEPNALVAVGAAAVVALAVVAAHTARVTLIPAVAHAGPPVSAQRRRRGSFLRQSNPDSAGRARPRAPGSEV